MAVDVGELSAPNVVVMKDGVYLARDQAEAVPFEQRFGLVAPIGQESRRPGCDRTFAHCGRLREHALRVELMPPAWDVADTPAHWREGQPVRGSRPHAWEGAHSSGDQRAEINLD